MFHIEEAPTGTTKCDWCKNSIEKSIIRLRFAPSKGYNYYWHQDCGIKYLKGLTIMLQKSEKGFFSREEAEKARKDVKL